jgi:hypothetical protein
MISKALSCTYLCLFSVFQWNFCLWRSSFFPHWFQFIVARAPNLWFIWVFIFTLFQFSDLIFPPVFLGKFFWGYFAYELLSPLSLSNSTVISTYFLWVKSWTCLSLPIMRVFCFLLLRLSKAFSRLFFPFLFQVILRRVVHPDLYTFDLAIFLSFCFCPIPILRYQIEP